MRPGTASTLLAFALVFVFAAPALSSVAAGAPKMLAVAARSPDRYAVAIREDGGYAVVVHEGDRPVARYDNAPFGYGWLYALAADDAADDRFLAVFADQRTARLVRLSLGADGLTVIDRAPLDLTLHVSADMRLVLASVHDLDVGRDGRLFLTGSFEEIRRTPHTRASVSTGRHPTVLVEITLVPRRDGDTRAQIAEGGRAFGVLDEEARHYRLAADRATGHVYAAPLGGSRVRCFRPYPRGFATVTARSFTAKGDALVDIAAHRGAVAVVDRGGADAPVSLYVNGRLDGRIAAGPGVVAVGFFAGDAAGARCTGGKGGILVTAGRAGTLAPGDAPVSRHRWCRGEPEGLSTAAR